MIQLSLLAARRGDVQAAFPALRRGLELGFPDGDGEARVGEVLETLLATPRSESWGAFWARAVDLAAFVGLCGFKAEPDAAGEVEIAYFTFPGFEGRGCAGAMAAALVERARAQGAAAVVAHTRPQESPSTGVLRANLFGFVGEAQEPQDGRVWAWRRPLA